MKKNLHPKYFAKAKVSCACGNEFVVGSTQEVIKTEICANCHPFYTGQQKLVDNAKRIEKFKEKMDKKSSVAESRKGKKAKNIARKAKKDSEK